MKTMIKKIIEWFGKSNRYKHLLILAGGRMAVIISDTEYSADRATL